jgi:Ni,Fe-hydrogenase maturation factor
MQSKFSMKKAKKLFNVYVLGNLLVEADSLPIKILPKLKSSILNVNFIELDPTENLPQEDHLVIIDTILGIDKITILKDINKIESQKLCSLHDCDLGFNLKLMKKMGKIKDVTIIGVPSNHEEAKAIKELSYLVSQLTFKK